MELIENCKVACLTWGEKFDLMLWYSQCHFCE